MGQWKEEYMADMAQSMIDFEEEYYYQEEEEYHQEINKQYEQKQKQNINQQNYLKMKKIEQAVEVKETKEETMKRLFLENGLVKEDVYKDTRGFVIITRTGIDKIVSKQNITVVYEPVVMQKDWVVMRATASMKKGHSEVRNMMSFGEASDINLMGGGKKFPVAMAEKRAMSRVVLKISGFYEQGMFGQDEIVD